MTNYAGFPPDHDNRDLIRNRMDLSAMWTHANGPRSLERISQMLYGWRQRGY